LVKAQTYINIDVYNTEIGNCYVTPISVTENTLVARHCENWTTLNLPPYFDWKPIALGVRKLMFYDHFSD